MEQIKEIEFTEGYYIPNTTATHDPTNMVANVNRKCAVVSCKAGDVFTINGESNSTQFNVFSIVDENNNALDRYGMRYKCENTLISIPEGGKTLILNSIITNTDKCYYGERLPTSYYADMKMII